MNRKAKFFVTFAICVLFFGTVVCGAETSDKKSPSAFLPSDKYKFEPVVDGTEVLHDFIIQNKGDAELTINEVKTG